MIVVLVEEDALLLELLCSSVSGMLQCKWAVDAASSVEVPRFWSKSDMTMLHYDHPKIRRTLKQQLIDSIK